MAVAQGIINNFDCNLLLENGGRINLTKTKTLAHLAVADQFVKVLSTNLLF